MRAGILSAGVLSFVAQISSAQSTESSLRPIDRPNSVSDVVYLASSGQVAPLAAARPKLRPDLLQPKREKAVEVVAMEKGFDTWVQDFKVRARIAGIRAATLEAAFQDVQLDHDVIKRDRNQSEFTKTIWQYLDSAVSESRIANGKAALLEQADILAAIEERYGVEKEVVVAVWGLESAYGTYRGSNDVVTSLATLSYEGRRGAFFETQLIAALQILQNGDTSPRNMTGSWAGAMGHTQFIPTSYLSFAVDFDGDGRRDIWAENPVDALASTAAYLRKSGWTTGQPWGVEVSVPKDFDYRMADRKISKTPAAWARFGVTAANGSPIPDHGPASILLPAGSEGAAFMIFQNFKAIERYNAADAYVIAVGHLSDRLVGAPPIRSEWPKDERALTLSERKEMQKRLTLAGFSTSGIDGRIGPKTIDAVRAYQQAAGLVADGYTSLTLLQRLR